MFEAELAELRESKRWGVFIDDSGSPGDPNTPAGLHPHRKSWVGVLLTPHESSEVLDQLPGALKELMATIGADEFHFTDIYSGRKAFNKIDPSVRLSIFRFMAKIFVTYRFPILVQTFSPDDSGFLELRRQLPEMVGPFRLSRPEDSALLMLLVSTKQYLTEKEVTAINAAHVFVDEGFQKRGATLRLPSFSGVFRDGAVHFAASHEVVPLQLADFAAFCLNRSQWILRKPTISEFDRTLLKILDPMTWNYVNIKRLEIRTDSWWGRGEPDE